MRVRHNYRMCRDCGHYGHHEGRRCPMFNVLGSEREQERQRVSISQMFPGRPDLIETLAEMQRTWRSTYQKECAI